VVCGRQRVTVVECPEGSVDEYQTSYHCNVGRGSPQQPVDVQLGESAALSRRAGQLRCIDGSWWQIRQVGANGLSLTTERGAILPVTTEWTDVPARYGISYVSVTTLNEVFEFKVEPNSTGPAPLGEVDAESAESDRMLGNASTRVIPKVGYWRVAVALCEPFLCDQAERVPTNPEIVRRLDQLALEAEGFTERAVEKRIKYLYDITGVKPGDRVGLRRRLTDSLVVVKDDAVTLLARL
jgi:hypothetical protein